MRLELSFPAVADCYRVGSECSQDEVTDIDCCMFAGTLPETIEVRWYYLTANSGIAIRLFCKNKHLPSDVR